MKAWLLLAGLPLASAAVWQWREHSSTRVRQTAVEITPELVDLGNQPYGSQLEVQTLVRNRTAAPIELVGAAPTSGCGFLQFADTRLGPGEATTAHARILVERIGDTTLVMPFGIREQDQLAPAVRVRMIGTPAIRAIPDFVYADSRRPRMTWAPIVLSVVQAGCGTATPRVRMNGPLGGEGRFERVDDSTWKLTLQLQDQDDPLFGALEHPVFVGIDDCAAPEAVVRIAFERTPPGREHDWPSCRIRIPLALPRASTITLPGVQLLDRVTSVDVPPCRIVAETIDSESATVRVRLDCDEPPRSFCEADLDLLTSIGTVRLRISAAAPKLAGH